MRFRAFTFLIAFATSSPQLVDAAQLQCENWQQRPGWLWCDDFESDSALERDYFDVNRAGGRMRVTTDAAFAGTAALRATYIPTDQDAGSIKLSLGKTPVAPKRYTDRSFQELYWRFYMRTSANWTGNAFKVTRGTVFSASNWSQAAIGHLWEDSSTGLAMALDPVTGVAGSQVVTTKYNDFDNLTWLGKKDGRTQVYASANRGVWTCIEVHMKLNSAAQSDGIFEFWVNDSLEARQTNLNFRGSYTSYGINAILMENYRNDPASQSQDRFFDSLVVSEQRIGCTGALAPNPPTDLRAN